MIKIFRILAIGVFLFVNFNSLLFAAELEDLKSEVQVLREEVKSLREELRAVKKEQPVAAAQKETVTQVDLQGVRTEVETLRDQWQRTLDKKTAQTTRSLTFGGTVATRYTQTRDETTKSGFSLSSLILSFKGNLRRDYELGRNLDYAFSLSSDTTDNYRVKPLDAYLTYSPLPSLDLEKPRLTLALGQQKKPFGRDPQTTEEYKPTLRSAQFDTNLGLGTRDIGFIAKGDLFPIVDYGFNYRAPLFEYAVGVINGAGPNTTDNNNQKDFVGRIGINAPVEYNSIFRGLSAGISGWTGQKSLSLGSGATAITRRGHKNRWGYDLAYNRTPIGVTAEYAQGTDATLSGSVANPVLGAVKSDGYAATVFYNFGQQFVKGFKGQNRYDDWYPLTYQPFVRFDSWDPNTHLGNDRINVTTLGFNWFFAETTKLQFNYNIVKKQDKSGSNGSGYNEFLAQFQYGF
ncbi:MAG: porin [Candidatus Omnitrophica bacterium]|nr:porin [Candidatus Omnitrophota bacterium]